MNFLKNLFKKQRGLNAEELRDFQEMNRLCAVERFKANHIRNNISLFKNGPTFSAQQDSLVTMLESIKEQWIAAKLTQLGYPKNERVAVDLNTGEINFAPTPEVREVAVPQMPSTK